MSYTVCVIACYNIITFKPFFSGQIAKFISSNFSSKHNLFNLYALLFFKTFTCFECEGPGCDDDREQGTHDETSCSGPRVACWVNHFTTNCNCNYILFSTLPWPRDNEGTFLSSSQTTICPPVYTPQRLHTYPFNC